MSVAKADRGESEERMRPRALIVDISEELTPLPIAREEAWERVERTLDDALAELILPVDLDDDKSGPHRL